MFFQITDRPEIAIQQQTGSPLTVDSNQPKKVLRPRSRISALTSAIARSKHDSITRASEFGIDDRVDELEATLGEKDDRINGLEATNEALREQLSDYQEVLERRDQYSNLE